MRKNLFPCAKRPLPSMLTSILTRRTASTTLFDGMYYELTYNGDKQELYFDAYKKWENKAIPVG